MATSPPKTQLKATESGFVEEPIPQNKSKKKLVIAIFSALVLGGGGAGAWFLTKDEAPGAPKVEVPITPIFVVFEPLTVNLKKGDGEDEYLQVALTAQVGEKEHEEMLKLYMPQVRSRLLLLLSTKTSEELATDEGKTKLMAEILEKIRQPYSEKGPGQRIMNIFFTSFVIQ